MPLLALHIKARSSKKNSSAIILTYYREGESGGFSRSLKHRGIGLTFLAIRHCTEEEYKSESNPWRYTFLHYHDWDSLIEDEKKYTTDPEWFDELNKLKKEWYWFKQEKQSVPPEVKVKPAIAKFKSCSNQLALDFSGL